MKIGAWDTQNYKSPMNTIQINCPECFHVFDIRFVDTVLSETPLDRPRIHNKKMLSAIREAVLDHSMNSQLADDVVRCLSPAAQCKQKDLSNETQVSTGPKEGTETGQPTLETWMPEARQLAAQCWCDPETKDRVMDVDLAEAVAKRIAAWMDSAAEFARNADYYRGLVVRIGEAIGEQAYIADDGSRSEDVLCAKVPELCESLISSRSSQPQVEGENQTPAPASSTQLQAEKWEVQFDETSQDWYVCTESHGPVVDCPLTEYQAKTFADAHNATLLQAADWIKLHVPQLIERLERIGGESFESPAGFLCNYVPFLECIGVLKSAQNATLLQPKP